MTPLPRTPLRVAMLTLHTSPLAQPGAGDAGGMNVYVRQLAAALAAAGAHVDLFTRGPAGSPAQEIVPGAVVHHVAGGPAGRITKEELPRHLPELVRAIAGAGTGPYDIVHSHYWMSGLAGLDLAAAWDAPLVHTMHTMGRVKKHHQPDADEPGARLRGEARLAAESARLTANTPEEVRELAAHYGADPARVDIVPPGVDLDVFHPLPRREDDGASRPFHVLFAGRIQKLKGPHVLVRALGVLARERPGLDVRLTVIGALSGAPGYNLQRLVSSEGLGHAVQFLPPVAAPELADWFRRADLVGVPSYSESFGLVAMEAQACGTPVLAHEVGGLRYTVADGTSGVLVPDLEPLSWAAAIAHLADRPAVVERLGAGAARHAAAFDWHRTARAALECYSRALGGPPA